jgi:hypothetical protein
MRSIWKTKRASPSEFAHALTDKEGNYEVWHQRLLKAIAAGGSPE